MASWIDQKMWALRGLLLLWVASSGVLAEPSNSGTSPSIGDLLKTAATNLGRPDHDLSKYEAKLEEDWITNANELQEMDVKTLSNYMPWGLAHEVHAIVTKNNAAVHPRKSAYFDAQVNPNSRMGISALDFDMHEVGDDDAASYFERNGLQSPSAFVPRERMLIQSNNVSSTTMSPGDNLTKIIEEAKAGNFHAARLRADLLNPDVYDKHAFPWDYVWYGKKVGNRTGIPLEFNINFQKVAGVDVINSVVDFVVWFRLVWYDPRLTWDPKEYDGMSEAWFWIGDGGAGGETTEIWTPDIELWNLEHGLKSTLEDTYAKVSSEGMVWWGRPGHLKPNCRFHGLNNFPFDHLTCAMEFGSWQYNGKFIQPVKHKGKGFNMELGATGDTAYHEFTFVEKDPVDVYVRTYPPIDPPFEDGWPVIMYNVTVARSWQPYARSYITTQIALNFVGFAAFWLPPSCGERMGLSITAMLAAVASETVVATSLPAAAEATWFSYFSLTSLGYAFFSLLECVVVLYFYYKTKEDCIPGIFKMWNMWRKARKQGENPDLKEQMTRAMETVTRHSTIDEDEEFLDNRISETDDPELPPVKKRGRRSILMKSYQESCAHIGQQSRDLTVPRDADDFANDAERENNSRWKVVAARIDSICQIIFPLTFVIAMAVLFSGIGYKEERTRVEIEEEHNWNFNENGTIGGV